MQIYLPIAEVSVNAFLLLGLGGLVGILSGMEIPLIARVLKEIGELNGAQLSILLPRLAQSMRFMLIIMRHIIAQLDVNVVVIEEDKIYMLKKYKD